MATLGRRPGPTLTKQQILDAARQQFAERGYRPTTLRSIADAAGVHPALVTYHFGSKQNLYRAALDMPVDPWEVLSRLLSDTPRKQLPETLVRHFVSTWRDPHAGPRLKAMTWQVRDHTDEPGMWRTHLQTVVIPRIAATLGIPEINVAAAFAHLIGLTMADTVICVAQLSTATEDQLVALVTPAIRGYLTPTPSRRR